jgi:F-type H+-transporting ATPase subunit b
MAGRLLARSALVLAWAAPLCASEGAEGGGQGASALITPEIGLMFWTLVTFLILLVLLAKFAWGPILKAMNAREDGIRSEIDNARKEREEAQRLLDEHRSLLNQARKERAEAVEAGRRDAERLKADILEDARKQREQLVQSAQVQIDAGLRQARSELKGEAADLAIRAAGKLIGSSLDNATQRKLVEDYLADLERLGSGSDGSTH